MAVEFEMIGIEKEAETQIIMGHAGFVKTVEDLYEAMADSVPSIRFGIAFAEASGPCLIRSEGNDQKLKQQAEDNLARIAAGHTFIIMFKGAFPINVTNAIKEVREVVRLYCATGNPLRVVVAVADHGRAIVGIADGSTPRGVESDDDRDERRKRLRELGYKR